jgi:hypothetical protein
LWLRPRVNTFRAGEGREGIAMRRRLLRLAAAAAFVGSAAGAGAAAAGALRTRVVPPLVPSYVSPGIGRCTSDALCVVTDAATGRTRAASRLTLGR